MGKIVKLLTAVLVLGFLVGCGGGGGSSHGGNTNNTTTPLTNIDCSDTDYIAGTTTCKTASNITFAFIPNGTFLMGANDTDAEAYEETKPQHNVTLTKDFFVGITEVTQGQWKAINGSNPSTHQYGDNYPVESVSWNDIQAFIAILNANEPNITINGVQYRYALPTEAQWEYAARAGTQTRFYFGDDFTDIDNYAWWATNSIDPEGWQSVAHEVAQLLPNAWGLYDVSGNMFEIVEDYLIDYSADPQTDPLNSSGTYIVIRGGNFHFHEMASSSTYRTDMGDRSGEGDSYGFRLALVSDR